MILCCFSLKLMEEQSVNGSDEEVEDDPPEQDTDFSDDDNDNKREHEEVKTSFSGLSCILPGLCFDVC